MESIRRLDFKMDKLGFSLGKKSHKPHPPAPYQPARAILKVGNAPDNSFALANVAAVNPRDMPDNSYIVVNDFYVFTTRHSNATEQGVLGLNGTQRQWAGLSLDQQLDVRTYSLEKETGRLAYIGTLNVEIAFRSRNKATAEPFDQDELGDALKQKFDTQIITPSQLFLMDFKGIIFELRVQGMQILDPADIENNGPLLSGVETKAVLMPNTQVNFFKGRDNLVNLKASSTRPRSDAVIRPDFKFEDMGVGGLDKEFTQIFRRAFTSRIYPPGVVEKLGVSHVKGMLLYGPPGTGKTLIARRIGKMLNAREPKIVNGPEILSKYVGSSEENIRNLFKDAEEEYKAKGEDSSLHIIIFDELDSVFKQRGSRGDGTGVGDNVVNQLLAKMDGVDQLNNILVIGMTNRRDLIDNALLRPGRFEVQVEITLPDEHGRLQILEIQTKKARTNNMMAKDVDLAELAKLTKNFSGAEIEGLVKSATSFALNQNVDIGGGATNFNKKNLDKLKVTRQDFLDALKEVTPAFGVNEEDLKTCIEGGIFKYSSRIEDILRIGARYVRQVQESDKTRLISVLMHGPSGSGKTALAAAIALQSRFPFIRMISAQEMTGMSEQAKIGYIDNTFRDAYKSPLNILVIDSIENIVDWVPIGPRFSNSILQILKIYLKRKPPKNNRLLIISTTSTYNVLQQMDILNCFDNDIAVPNVTSLQEFNKVMIDDDFLNDSQRTEVLSKMSSLIGSQDGRTTELDIGIKKVLMNLETAKHDEDPINEIVNLMASS